MNQDTQPMENNWIDMFTNDIRKLSINSIVSAGLGATFASLDAYILVRHSFDLDLESGPELAIVVGALAIMAAYAGYQSFLNHREIPERIKLFHQSPQKYAQDYHGLDDIVEHDGDG